MEGHRLIIWSEFVDRMSSRVDAGLLGGKGYSLYFLTTSGMNVPPWCVLTTRFFRGVGRDRTWPQSEPSTPWSDVESRALELQREIRGIEWGRSQSERLRRVWRKISDSGRYPLAVRSSAVLEDGSSRSFAGVLDTHLNVGSEADLRAAVADAWASLYNQRALVYRRQYALPPFPRDMAVIVQRMVVPDLSGVVFTINPVDGNPEEAVIQATWGTGLGVVSDECASDRFIVQKANREISSEIACKETAVVCHEAGGVAQRIVPQEKRNTATLDRGTILELFSAGEKIASLMSAPADIEFSVKDGVVYLLQARPITTQGGESPNRDNHLIWDNSNIVESYAGVTSPLTFSFIKHAYARVYRQFCEVVGVPGKIIEANGALFENMLGHIMGRVYYNLRSWYRVLTFLPGYRYNKAFLTQMMGARDAVPDDAEIGSCGFLDRYLRELPKLIWTGIRLLWILTTLKRRMRRFLTGFKELYLYYDRIPFDELSAAELVDVSRDMERRILDNWKSPILNDLKCMIFFGLLRKLTVSFGLDETGMLANDLLSGVGGVKSTEVVSRLFTVADEIGRRNGRLSRFVDASTEDALSMVRSDERIRALFDEYLAEYGSRAVEELKLESVPVSESPEILVSLMQSRLRSTDTGRGETRQRQLRAAAEKAVGTRLRFPRRWIYRWIVNHTRQAIRAREEQRFCRADAYGLFRRIVRSIGRTWESSRIIDRAEDIFHLTWEEIVGFVDGTLSCPNLKELVRLRRDEFAEYRRHSLPDRFETTGEALAMVPGIREPAALASSGILRGAGCCSGCVEGRIVRVEKPYPDEKLKGRIMVARQTDPGWIVVYPLLRGMIIEKGSMLSHSAIVAREMGIPAVVGVPDAADLLEDGEWVRLDGASGTVERLGDPERHG